MNNIMLDYQILKSTCRCALEAAFAVISSHTHHHTR